MSAQTNVKWHITDTLAVDVQVTAVEGDHARVVRDGRKLVVRTSELDLNAQEAA